MIKDKAQISNLHSDNLKAKYMVGKQVMSEGRAVLVVGSASPGQPINIGGMIYQVLARTRGKTGYCERVDGVNIGDYNLIHSYDCIVMTRKFFVRYPFADTLVLSHGDMDLQWFEEMEYENYEYLIRTNLLSHMNAIKSFVNASLHRPYKKYIVVIGSMAYDSVLNASAPYCAAKAGLAMLVRCLAWELAPKNYNVFILHPSNVQGTPMTKKTIQKICDLRNCSLAEAEEYWGAILPKDEFLTMEEIAEHVKHLVSGKADYLSGTNIELRGGQR